MNLPNKLTLLRVLIIPVFLYFYMSEPLAEEVSRWVALILFSVAAITDALDGYLARKYKLVTNFGKLMDPLADKLLVCSAFVAFVASGTLPAWVVILLICREFYITGLRQLALEQNLVLASSAGGKIKTVVQIVLIIYLLQPIQLLYHPLIVDILVVVSVVSSVASAAIYTARNISKLRT